MGKCKFYLALALVVSLLSLLLMVLACRSMGNNIDNTDLVELGFAAGACDVAAVCMMCDLLKLITLPWKGLME